MILTKEQIEKRLASDSNVLNQINKPKTEVIVKDGKNKIGRPGSHNLTEEEKINIGYLANVEGKEIAAELFGISGHTAGHLKTAQRIDSHGAGTQRYVKDHELEEKIKEKLTETKLTVSERAAERLLASFGFLTDEKLENCNAKDLSSVASQISNV